MAFIVISIAVLIVHDIINKPHPREDESETEAPLQDHKQDHRDDMVEVDRKLLDTLAGLPDLVRDEEIRF
jgi:hypothetical protein